MYVKLHQEQEQAYTQPQQQEGHRYQLAVYYLTPTLLGCAGPISQQRTMNALKRSDMQPADLLAMGAQHQKRIKMQTSGHMSGSGCKPSVATAAVAS